MTDDLFARGREIAERLAANDTTTTPTTTVVVVEAEPDRKPPQNGVSGAQFVLDRPVGVPSVWGHGNQVLWSSGEALMIAGGQGLGKTTLALQIVRELLGIGAGSLLGLPVSTDIGRVLYLAMDRPNQIARAAGRIFTEADRPVLTESLHVWRGPPTRDLAANPDTLARMADYYEAGVVVVDSLKDAAVRLSEDAVGSQWNRARQNVLAQGCQILELHHTKKRNLAQPHAGPSVDDVYGSTWLTSGCGSIVLLGGEPGDPIVSFRHVKQPAEEVGPYRLLHDQTAGVMTVDHAVDLVAMVRASGVDGLTAQGAAAAITEKRTPSRGDVEKARRKLDQLATAGVLVRLEGTRGGGESRQRTAWFLAENQSRGNHESEETAGEAITQPFADSEYHASITPITKNRAGQVEQSREQSRQSHT